MTLVTSNVISLRQGLFLGQQHNVLNVNTTSHVSLSPAKHPLKPIISNMQDLPSR